MAVSAVAVPIVTATAKTNKIKIGFIVFSKSKTEKKSLIFDCVDFSFFIQQF